jgi:hypothetical protein
MASLRLREALLLQRWPSGIAAPHRHRRIAASSTHRHRNGTAVAML